MRKAQRSGRWAFLTGVISSGFFCVQLFAAVPTAWLTLCCLPLVALSAQSTSIAWIIGVHVKRNEVGPTVWVVVSHNAWPDVAQYADGVTVQHAEPERDAVRLAVVCPRVVPVCTLCILGMVRAA
jgi:hypothetical protein